MAATELALTAGREAERRRWRPALAVPYRYFALRYRRTWRATLTQSFLYPILYLLGMGLGLGHLVDAHLATHGGDGRLGGVGYLQFIAPGLLVASAMQWGTNESMYPVMDGLKYLRTYYALLATPIEVKDVVHAHIAWVATRVAACSAIFLVVLAAFGDVVSPWAVFSLAVAVLTGVAFTAPVAAFVATQENDAALPIIFRIGVVPLFLFSGTFFPIGQLPGWLQVIARLTPVYHGVALARGLLLGQLSRADDLGHAAYLVVMALVGLYLARRNFERRIVV